jgi:hypothetical protein
MKIGEIEGTCYPDIGMAARDHNDILFPENDLISFDYKDQSKRFLQKALVNGSLRQYEKALYLREYRDKLLQHVEELRANTEEEAREKHRYLAPRVFGWQNCDEMNGITNNWQILKQKMIIKNGNAKDVLGILRSMDIQSFPLEEKLVSDRLFLELEQKLITDECFDIDPEFIQESYPHLYPFICKKKRPRKLFRHDVYYPLTVVARQTKSSKVKLQCQSYT